LDDDDHNKVIYDKKAKIIVASALWMDEFFRISNCKTIKVIWDTLETIHKGTEEEIMTLMVSHHSDDDQEVNDSELIKPSYEELQNAFDELHEECINLAKTRAKQKKLIVSLERKVFDA